MDPDNPAQQPQARFEQSVPDLLTILALDYATRSRTESPWYGLYGLTLTEGLTAVDLERKMATLIIPQLRISTKGIKEQEPDEPGDIDMVVDNDQDDVADISMESGSSDPLNLPWSKNEGEQRDKYTDGDSESETESIAEQSLFKNMTRAQIKRIRSYYSTRIPDFSRVRLYLDEDGEIMAQRIDLLVEIKISVKLGKKFGLTYAKARVQVTQQIQHAFAQDENLGVVGCIIAIGGVWTYDELGRTEVSDLDHDLDSTYEPSSSPQGPQSDVPISVSSSPASSSNSNAERGLPESFKSFAENNIAERKEWFRHITERLNQLDNEINGPYLRKQEASAELPSEESDPESEGSDPDSEDSDPESEDSEDAEESEFEGSDE